MSTVFTINSNGITEIEQFLVAYGKPGLKIAAFLNDAEQAANDCGMESGQHAKIELAPQFSEDGRPHILGIERSFFDESDANDE